METLIKGIVVLFVLFGLPVAVWGAWKLYGSAREETDPDRSSDGDKRPVVHYVFSVRFLLIVAVGIAFVLIPLLIWRVGAPMLETPAGVEMATRFESEFAEILEWRVGPVTVRSMFIGFGLFFALVFFLSLVTKIVKR